MVTISSQSVRNNSRPPLWKVWLVAARPHTLTAAIAPCIVGSCLTYYQHNHFPTRITVLWTLFCICVQLGTNLHNDYADFVKGADTDARVGHSRATQKGWLTPEQTAQGATAVLMGNLLIGLYFLYQIQQQFNNHHDHHKSNFYVDWFFLFVVVSSIFNAFAYTGGPYPLGYIGLEHFSIGYSGLGDVFVFLYFGIVATAAIPYLYDRIVQHPGQSLEQCLQRLFLVRDNQQPTTLAIASMQVGLMATNILVVNNLRDRHTDVHAGKKTLAVRLGGTFCRVQYTLQNFGAYLLVLLDYTLHRQQQQQQLLQVGNLSSNNNFIRLLPLLSLPFARREIEAIWKTDGSALNSHVGKTALLEFLFCILLGVALLKSPH